MITMMLGQLGYTVLAAASGQEAIEMSQRERRTIALLVTDVVMPKMSGKQLADALGPSRPDMKILYLSGYTENTVGQQGALDATIEFLAKPFSRDMLGKKIRDILGGPAGGIR